MDNCIWIIVRQEDEIGGYMGSGPGSASIIGATYDFQAASAAVGALDGKMRGGYLSYRTVKVPICTATDFERIVNDELGSGGTATKGVSL
jgi:hypothetical protein